MNIAQLRQRFQFLQEFTDEEVASALIAAHGVTNPSDPRYGSLEQQLLGYDRTTGEKLRDAGIGLVQGVAGLGQTAGVIGGAITPGVRAFDNPITNTFREFGDSLDQYKSGGLRAQELGSQVAGDIAVRQAAAEGAGTAGRILAGGRAQIGSYVSNPGLAVQDAIQSAPSLLAGGFVGRGVQAGAGALGLSVRAATHAGMAGGVGASGTLQGGDVAADTYQRMRQAGADYDTATSEASAAGAKAAAASVGLTMVPGGATIERSMIRGAGGRGGFTGALRGGAAEFASEAGEEGYGQFAGNQAVRTVDPSVDLAQGVGQAAVQGGFAAAPIGGVAGMKHRAAPAPAPRTEIGEIDLTGSRQYAEFDTPAFQRRGLDPTFERSSPLPADIQAQERARALAAQPGTDGQGGVPGFLQNDQNIPPFLRAEPTMADIAGPAVNPVQRGEPSMAELVAPQTPSPFDAAPPRPRPLQPGPLNAQDPFSTSGLRDGDVAAPGEQSLLDRAPNLQTAPGAVPERGNTVEFTRDVDTGDLAIQQPGQAPAKPGRPSVGAVLVALEKANAALGKNVIRKDGQVSQASGTAPLRAVLEAKDPVATMRDLYQDGKNPRDELLDVWHRELTGQTIAETRAAPVVAPTPTVAGSASASAPAAQAVVGAPDPMATGAPVAPAPAQVQLVAGEKPTLAQRKISARVDGAAAAMDGHGPRANPHKPGTAAYKEWLEGHDEVKARAEAAKENPIAKKLVKVVDSTKDETLYDESLFALYKLAANGDVTAYNYFQSNGYYDDISASGRKLKPAQAAEMKKLRERWEMERGQQRGKKFGAAQLTELVEEPKKDILAQIVEDDDGNIGLRRRSVLVGLAGFLSNLGANAGTTLGRAKPISAAALDAKVPPAVEKILRGNGKTNPVGAKALREALQLISVSGPAELRELSVNILKLMPNTGLMLTVDDKGLPNAHGSVELSPVPHMILYTADGRTGLSYGTMLHEALHVAAAARYRSLSAGLVRSNDAILKMPAPKASDAMAQFRKVWEEFREVALDARMSEKDKNVKLALSTSMADPDEFFVRSLTDPHLQAWMARTEYKGKTLWERFKNWVKTSLFGMKSTGQVPSWLDAALIASTDLTNEMSKDPSDFKRLKAVNSLNSEQRSAKNSVKDEVLARFSTRFGQATDPSAVAKQTEQALTALREQATDYRSMAQQAMNRGKVETAQRLLETVQTYEQRAQELQKDLKVAKAAEAITDLAGDKGDVLLSALAEEAPTTKPLAEGARALTATVKAQIKGEELNESLLNMMTLRQIDEQFGKKLPALRDWVNVVMERSTNASKLAAEADRVALQWQQNVPRDEMKPLAELLLRASNAELQLDKTDAKYLAELSPEERKEHTELRAKLQALSPAAKQARKDALDVLKRQWDYTHEALTKFITLTVSDPLLRAERLAGLQQEFGRNHGDYFPLSRFGDRVVIARAAAKDGRDVITFHESPKGVEDEVRRLKDSGVKPDSIIVTMSTEYDPRKVPGTGFVRELHAMIDNITAGEEAQQLHQTLQQLYLKSLPELSGAKHMVRRENIEGFSQDALRVFADAVTRGSRYASHLEFGPAVHAAMEAAEAQSRSSDKRAAAVVIGRKDGQQPLVKVVGTGTQRLQAVEKMAADGYAVEFFSAHPETVAERLAGALEDATPEELAKWVLEVRQVVKKQAEGVEDLRAAKQLYNYMVRAQKADINPHPSKLVDIGGQLGYAWYLGFSPAFWMMNTLQNPMVGIPHLGGKYGTAKASKEWMRAASWFAKVRIGKRLAKMNEPFSVEWLREQVKAGELKGVNKDELDMLQRLEDRQVLDFTQAMDLSHIGSASNSTWYKAMRLAAAGAHHTEVFNRVSFALAAYRLAMKSRSDMTHDEAARAAERDVAAAHFDYSYANKPLWMGKSTPAVRLVFMFQQYRQHMLYWWANTIKEATKGESKEVRSQARKAALLMGTTQLLFAGTMGLPFVGAVATLWNLLAGGDDGEEPPDFERWMREAAVGMTGSEAGADVVTKGIFAALGMDISKRIGQGDLLPLLNPGSARFERNFDDKARAYLFDMLGPLGSIALGAFRATEAFADGHYMKGLAATTPKAVADILRAYQQGTEGLKDKRGLQLATEEAFDGWDAAFQAAGVTPTSVANVKQGRGAVLDIQNAFRDQSRRLTGAFIESWSRGDPEGMTEALADIRRYNQNIAKGRLASRQLLITPDRIRAAIVERQRRAMLLALSGGLADTRQQLLIATRISGLYDLDGRDVRLDSAGLPALEAVD